MCGIVGAIAGHDIVSTLVDGLKRLEYRGYDSAGVAVLMNGEIKRVRKIGRVAEMERATKEAQLTGNLGIGHTRWATHGGVTEPNAHPHVSGGLIAVVHNGIIENHDEERARLQKLGYKFESQTDTEVIAHLVHYHYQESGVLFTAVKQAMRQLKGAYAIAVIAADQPDRMVCARMGCPLLIGIGQGAHYVASDVSAILSATRRVIFLEDGDVAELGRDGMSIVDGDGAAVERQIHQSDVSLAGLSWASTATSCRRKSTNNPKPSRTPSTRSSKIDSRQSCLARMPSRYWLKSKG